MKKKTPHLTYRAGFTFGIWQLVWPFLLLLGIVLLLYYFSTSSHSRRVMIHDAAITVASWYNNHLAETGDPIGDTKMDAVISVLASLQKKKSNDQPPIVVQPPGLPSQMFVAEITKLIEVNKEGYMVVD